MEYGGLFTLPNDMMLPSMIMHRMHSKCYLCGYTPSPLRDNGDGLHSQDCLKIFGEYLPQEQPIHRHCFVGSVIEMQNWLKAFPGTVFGFTAKILNGDHHPDLPEAVRTHLSLQGWLFLRS